MLRPLLLTVCLALPAIAAAQTPARADYQRIQAVRDQVDDLLGKGGEENARTAIALLQGILDDLDRPEVAERGVGYAPLWARNHDARMDLARAYAALGDKQKALDTLEQMQRYVWLPAMPKLLGETAPELKVLHGEPRWEAFVKRAELPARLWKPPLIATPFKERLTVEERIAGLSLYWAEARQHFAWFDHVPDMDWTAVYMEFLPKVMAAETTRDYYRVMMQLAPRLKDGHTNIYPPRELRDEFYARPALRTRKVEDRVVVTEVMSKSLRQRVAVGDEVVSIDGMPVHAYARERVLPVSSASTPQDLDVRMYTYQLLAGHKDQPVRLGLVGADGRTREEVVARSGFADLENEPPFAFRMLPGDIAYLSLDQFETNDAVKEFTRHLPTIMQAKGLVLDVRRNGGGNSTVGLEILSSLVHEPIPMSDGFVRLDYGARRNELIQWRPDHANQSYDRRKKEHFDGPVAVLIGPQSYSAAEDFLVSFDLVKRGPMVGEATGGSTGQPMMVPLPGGGLGRICSKRDTYPDGRAFVGRGIQPTIVVKPTVEDIRKGEDRVLAAAVAALRR